MEKHNQTQEIQLHYSGSFEKDHSLTARTVSHGLSFLQRIIDKAVLFEKRGVLKKGDALPNIWYPEADLEVKNFKKGCVTIPLIGPKQSGVIKLLKGALYAPYQHAISDTSIEKSDILESLNHAFNRAVNNIDISTHQELINNTSELSRRYFVESIYKDFDNLISPLRSTKIKETDEIAIELTNNGDTIQYEFSKETSQRFHKIVSQKKLGPVLEFNGRLTGLVETKSKDFPYKGIFFSKASGYEHKLLINSDKAVDQLRMYTASKKLELSIYACPIVAWGAFDAHKGDLVFVKLA